jgi:hypothetical protein
MNIEDIATFDNGVYICNTCGEKKPKMGIWTHWRIQHTESGREKIERSREAATRASSELVPCPNCNELFPKSGLSSHILAERRAEKKREKILSKTCERCEQAITEVYGSGRFCSQKCARGAATSAKREEINKKTSESIKKKYSHLYERKTRECSYCNKEFVVSHKKPDKKFCKISCASNYRYSEKNPDFENNMRLAQLAGISSAQSQRETRRSKNEIYFAELCSSAFSNVLCNEPMFDGWDADVIIPELKIAVLWNGPWHRRKITQKHSVAQVQKRDEIKRVKIHEAGYIMYVVDDEGKYDKNFVEKEFEKFIKLNKLE